MPFADTLPSAITHTGLFQDYYLIHRLAPSLPLAPTTMAESDAALVKIAALWEKPSMKDGTKIEWVLFRETH